MQAQQHSQFVQQPQLQYAQSQPASGTSTIGVVRNGNYLLQKALSQMKVLSIFQVVLGGLCVVFGIALASFEDLGDIGIGIWMGIYYIIVGGIGLGAVRSNTKCWIVSTMVLNILCSCLFCTTMVATSSVRVHILSYLSDHYDSDWDDDDEESLYNSAVALNILLLIIGLVEFVITIWCAALCCGAVCACCKPISCGQVIQYHPNQPQVVMYGSPSVFSGSQPVVVQRQQIYPACTQMPLQPEAPSVYSPNRNHQAGQYMYPNSNEQTADYTSQPELPPSYQSIQSDAKE